ncbi:MAG: YebC/PmpR family DNA-binding transcriptional regulator [Bacteroidia bacterium]|nr:YebC/PmpR family DNA-binding transcriptional regulator [Bacteroidia bacterium]
MSGHSKWSTIKRKKGAADAKRSKIFSKIIKEIQIAVKEGGADPEGNPRLRLAIQNARGANMPKDNVTRAISKGSDTQNYSEIVLEGYAPSGVALIVECLSDNKNRTVSNIRAMFTKRGGKLESTGSVSYLFDRKGIFNIPKAGINQEEFELSMIDAGAEDIEDAGDMFILYTAMEDFGNIQRKLEEMNIEPENARLQRIPNISKNVDIESAKKVLNLIEDFEEDDDVQNVYHNLEMTDELLKHLG